MSAHRTFNPEIGSKYNRLTVLAGKFSRYPKVTCRCDCGTVHDFDWVKVRRGAIKLCGCYHLERLRERSISHGESSPYLKVPEYRAWTQILRRCYSVNVPEYPDYGGRGIVVSDRWRGKQGYVNFLTDMGRKPTPKHTIDRYPNNDGNYEPGNCRWATMTEQNRNRRSNIRITVGGVTKCLTERSEIYGVCKPTLEWRVRHGWPPEKAVIPPLRRSHA